MPRPLRLLQARPSSIGLSRVCPSPLLLRSLLSELQPLSPSSFRQLSLPFLRSLPTSPSPKSLGLPRIPSIPVYTHPSSLAYLALRFPSSFAAHSHIFHSLLPLSPVSLLDFGAGPAVASLAAAHAWPHVRCVALDREHEMNTLAAKLAQGIANVSVVQQNHQVEGKRFEMVVAGYVLSEIAAEEMGKTGTREQREHRAGRVVTETVDWLWERVQMNGVLVVVESATAAGFETVNLVRDVVRGKGGSIVAPCVWEGDCPLARNGVKRGNVCAFEQRFNVPALIRRVRRMHNGYEDERFSYVVIRKTPDAEEVGEERQWARVLKKPIKKAGRIVLEACTKEGQVRRIGVSKRQAGKEHFVRARKVRWGDLLDTEIHGLDIGKSV